MNIKSLLLGSAAALVAVSGARAADAIIAAEPEPVEYVRVCDAFGTGYFYIPGTETCLRIHGYVRYDIEGGELYERTTATGDETYMKRARASFRVSTASETEMGALRTYIETRWQWDTNGRTNAVWSAANPARLGVANGYSNENEFSINFAWIQLGGLRIGKDESFFTTWTGYAGAVIKDGVYGPFDTNLVSYTYDSGAFRAGIALEQGVDSLNVTYNTVATGGGALTAAQTNVAQGWGIDDYMPHVVVGVGYNAGMVDLSAVVGYDTRDDYVFGGVLRQRGGWAGKVRADVTINDQASVFAMLMYGENTSAYASTDGWANGAANMETFSVIAGGTYIVSDKLNFNTQVQWIESNTANDDAWQFNANLNYDVVPGLTVTPEFVYSDSGAPAGGQVGGVLRVQRSF
jgi:hypothetical protein